jgi:hypothetical protein
MSGDIHQRALLTTRGRWSPPWPVLKRKGFPCWSRSLAWPVWPGLFSSRPVALPQSRLPLDSRPPSLDEPRSPAQYAAATSPAAPALLPAAASFRSRHCPCQLRLLAPRSEFLSWASNMAGFGRPPRPASATANNRVLQSLAGVMKHIADEKSVGERMQHS